MITKTYKKTIFSLFGKQKLPAENIRTRIKAENAKRPHKILSEYGAIPKVKLDNELLKYDFSFPEKLKEFWTAFGGGEIFQGETILYPLPVDNDLIESVIYYNNICLKKGMKPHYFIFSTDTVNHTAFHKQTHEIICFEDDQFKVRYKFENFVDWFDYIYKIQG